MKRTDIVRLMSMSLEFNRENGHRLVGVGEHDLIPGFVVASSPDPQQMGLGTRLLLHRVASNQLF